MNLSRNTFNGRSYESCLALSDELIKLKRGREALDLLKQYEEAHNWDVYYEEELLRLTCLFGERAEAHQRLKKLRERSDFIEVFMQADEDFLPVWNARPESVAWRSSFYP